MDRNRDRKQDRDRDSEQDEIDYRDMDIGKVYGGRGHPFFQVLCRDTSIGIRAFGNGYDRDKDQGISRMIRKG